MRPSLLPLTRQYFLALMAGPGHGWWLFSPISRHFEDVLNTKFASTGTLVWPVVWF